MASDADEEAELRSVALENARTIQIARKKAEQELVRAKEALSARTAELAHSLALMRATLESTTDAILVIDEHGQVTDVNENWLRMWAPPPDLRSRGDAAAWRQHLADHFADPEAYRQRLDEIDAENLVETHDVLFLSDGRVVERTSRLQVVEGRRVGRVWSFRDVTATRRAEDALREETGRLEILDRTGAILSSKLELEEVVRGVTDAATQLSGAQFGAFFYNTTNEAGDSYTLFTLSGAPREAFERFGHPRSTAVFSPTFRGEGPIRSDDILADPRYGQMGPHHGMPPGHLPVRSYLAVAVRSRSGEVIGGLFFGHPEPGVFTERSEQLVVGIAAQAAVAIDNARLYEAARQAASERTRLLEAERIARAEAERASAMKDEFLATLSHELRTPLSAILGWSQLLRRPTSRPEDLQHGLATIERNARAQTQLIEDLLDMSRITSGKVRLDVQTLDPMPVIDAALEAVRPAAAAKDIRIDRLLDPSAGPISGDPNRLQQVVWNLLSNAIKFTPKGGKVQVVLMRVNSHIELSVSDTGIGIRPEVLHHVFERFRQGDASTTRSYGGLGLGLAIVKHLVELHGGTVRVHSPGEGKGARFEVHLPIAVVHAPTRSADRQHPTRSAHLDLDDPSRDAEFSDLTGTKVLVVDDELDARELVRRVLSDCGAEVATAGNALDALIAVERHRPHVLVCDIGMPGVDGFELLRRIRSLGPERGGAVPAIALTAFARSEDRTRALRAGFEIHVSKPVEPGELSVTVARVAEQSR